MRLLLDAGLRLPRKHLLRFAGVSLLLVEPSLQHEEATSQLSGISAQVQTALLFVAWTDQNLEEYVEFFENLPYHLLEQFNELCMQRLYDSGSEKFPQLPGKIDVTAKGAAARELYRANWEFETQQIQNNFRQLADLLGVHIQAHAESEAEDPDVETTQSETWIPLGALIARDIWYKIQEKLVPEAEKEKLLKNTNSMFEMPREEYARTVLTLFRNGVLGKPQNEKIETYIGQELSQVPTRPTPGLGKPLEQIHIGGRWSRKQNGQ